MTAKHRQHDAGGVALFPFLAVLLCTMGALILILVVIARNVRVAERQKLDAVAEVGEDLETKLSTARWRVEQLVAARDKTLADLSEFRAELSHLEDHARQLQDELNKQDAALMALEEQLNHGTKPLDEMRIELADVEEKTRRSRDELERLAEELKKRKPAYAIIPYDGPSGTRRRPIYVECRGDSVVIHPEGIVLREIDFLGNMGPSNALAAALRAAREYLGRRHPTATSSEGEPYPLLLVRPEGIGSYYAARQAMTSWGTEFGYEFIDSDWPLKLPTPDPTLASLMTRAVEEARRRQITIAMAAPGLLSAEDRLALAAMAQAQAGGGSLGGSGGGGWGVSGNGGWGGGSANGSPTGGSPANVYGPASTVAGTSGMNAGGAGGTGSFAGVGGTGNQAAGGHPSGGLNTPGIGPAGFAGTGSPMSSSSHPGGTSAGGNSGGAGTGPYKPSDGAGELGSNLPSASSANGANGGPGGTSNSPGGGPTGQPGQYANGSNNGGAAKGGNSSANGTARGASGGGGSMSGPSFMANSSSSGGSGSSSSAGGTGGAGAPAALQSMGSPNLSMTFNQNPQPSQNVDMTVEPISRQRGANWGLPESIRNGTVSVTRPISIECHEDRLVVRGEGAGGRGDESIPLQGDTTFAVDALIKKLHGRIESWGIAGNGMVWRPLLIMNVGPSGARRYSALRVLLEGSGLELRDATVLMPAQQPAQPLRR